ncbi:hypothetical protein [Rhodopila sp.]|uniref:hypothetical protein n=1 Tax=Rhodopila sp. TaxID=2480087 RepID=UPI002BE5ACA1|nr:hypothetical protein [Rhodopila sp.]HVZ09563.1 hypothetical protein [Rhodopila sp.]
MPHPADAIARDQVYRSLIPFFLEAADGNRTGARAAAEAMIAGFSPASHEEFILAAQTIVYCLAGFDSLCRSKDNPGLSESTHLRLRGNAGTMQRASQQCLKALAARRKAGDQPQGEPRPSQPHQSQARPSQPPQSQPPQSQPHSASSQPAEAADADAMQPASPPFVLTEADVEAAVQKASAIILQAQQAVAQPARKPKYWEVRREAERQARLARRAARPGGARIPPASMPAAEPVPGHPLPPLGPQTSAAALLA